MARRSFQRCGPVAVSQGAFGVQPRPRQHTADTRQKAAEVDRSESLAVENWHQSTPGRASVIVGRQQDDDARLTSRADDG